jgi:hypothetical protein
MPQRITPPMTTGEVVAGRASSRARSTVCEGIAKGALDAPSDYAAAAGRPHVGWDAYFEGVRQAQG